MDSNNRKNLSNIPVGLPVYRVLLCSILFCFQCIASIMLPSQWVSSGHKRERSYIGYTEELHFKQLRKVQMSITMSISPGRACKMA